MANTCEPSPQIFVEQHRTHVTAAAKSNATCQRAIGSCQVTEPEVQGGDLPAFVTR
jgi:hypothetical protein